MPIESASYVSQLDANNPVGTDDRSTLDNQDRLIKQVLVNTFNDLRGPVSASAGEMNFLVGVTANLQTQLNNTNSLLRSTSAVLRGELVSLSGVLMTNLSTNLSSDIHSLSSVLQTRITNDLRSTSAAIQTVINTKVTSASACITTVMITDNSLNQAKIADAAVGQGELKTTTGEVSVAGTGNAGTVTLPGGTYGFYPQIKSNNGNGMSATIEDNTAVSSTYFTAIRLSVGSADTAYAQQRYVQASPPYDLGDGLCGLFIFVLVNSDGTIAATYCAADAPWHNNGPTDIRAKYTDAQGRRFRKANRLQYERLNGFDIKQSARTVQGRTLISQFKEDKSEYVIEITQQIKQADMPQIPQPFLSKRADQTVVLLDPVCDMAHMAVDLLDSGESISELLHNDYLRFHNSPLSRATPPGVIAVSPRWRIT